MRLGRVLFQAEDGIRDLVRSRGLGDVYKRQEHQVDDVVREIKTVTGEGRRVLITTLTKRMAEDLSLIHI